MNLTFLKCYRPSIQHKTERTINRNIQGRKPKKQEFLNYRISTICRDSKVSKISLIFQPKTFHLNSPYCSHYIFIYHFIFFWIFLYINWSLLTYNFLFYIYFILFYYILTSFSYLYSNIYIKICFWFYIFTVSTLKAI